MCVYYKKITSYPPDGCVSRCREGESWMEWLEHRLSNMLSQLFPTFHINVFKCLTTLLILFYDPYGGVIKFPIFY